MIGQHPEFFRIACPNAIQKKSEIDLELTRIKCGLVETLFVLSIVALLAIGGLFCLFKHIEGGQAVVAGVLGLVAGYFAGSKKNVRRS